MNFTLEPLTPLIRNELIEISSRGVIPVLLNAADFCCGYCWLLLGLGFLRSERVSRTVVFSHFFNIHGQLTSTAVEYLF